MYECHSSNSRFTYCENKEDVTQRVKVDLADQEMTKVEKLKSKIESIDNGQKVFVFEGKRKLIYATEALTPNTEANKGGINLLLLLGNPAIHSVKEGMFFSYEGKKGKRGGGKKEHRFWEGLRRCGLYKEPKLPLEMFIGDKYIAAINDRKQKLLKGQYEGDHNFNIFLMTYFSFPTPPSKKKDGSIYYSEVAGIKKIFRESDMSKIFEDMLEFEFCRFKHVVSSNKITNVICFQKGAWDAIIKKSKDANLISNRRDVPNELKYPVYEIWLSDKLSKMTLYRALSTRLILSDKSKVLAAIMRDIGVRANSGSLR